MPSLRDSLAQPGLSYSQVTQLRLPMDHTVHLSGNPPTFSTRPQGGTRLIVGPRNTPSGVLVPPSGKTPLRPRKGKSFNRFASGGPGPAARVPTTVLSAIRSTPPTNSSPAAPSLIPLVPISFSPFSSSSQRSCFPFNAHQIAKYQKQQRPPATLVHDSSGHVRGLTRQYLNPRTTWIATQAALTTTSVSTRIQSLSQLWSGYSHWTRREDQYWLQLALKHKDPIKCLAYATNSSSSCNLNHHSILLLLEGMTKIHVQLELNMPSLPKILEEMTETGRCYAQKLVTLDPASGYKLPAGDMAAVDFRLYSILIHHFKITAELFAGAINHHPLIQTWYSARKQDQFWGGLYDSLKEPT